MEKMKENNLSDEIVTFSKGSDTEKTISFTPSPSSLVINIYVSKKTNNVYYGTYYNNKFFFVHIENGVTLLKKVKRLSGIPYYIYSGEFTVIDTEESKDIYIKNDKKENDKIDENDEIDVNDEFMEDVENLIKELEEV